MNKNPFGQAKEPTEGSSAKPNEYNFHGEQKMNNKHQKKSRRSLILRDLRFKDEIPKGPGRSLKMLADDFKGKSFEVLNEKFSKII